MLMTGKLNYRVDDNQIELVSYPGGPCMERKRTGRKTADLEISIDLDKLREALVAHAMSIGSCKLSRMYGAIVVRPVKGSVKVTGHGSPRMEFMITTST